MTNITYTDYVAFVLRHLPNYGKQYHSWTEEQASILGCIVAEVKSAAEEYSDVPSLAEFMERSYGLVVPVVWGTLAVPYFKNWYNLYTNWSNKEVNLGN